jgi:hypothetical protein
MPLVQAFPDFREEPVTVLRVVAEVEPQASVVVLVGMAPQVARVWSEYIRGDQYG